MDSTELRMSTGNATLSGCPLLKTSQLGVSYLWLLVMIALLGVSSAVAGMIYATDAKREREQELIRIGREFKAALTAYFEASPGEKRYPTSLEHLLRDPRRPGVKRHLRRIYVDPITGKAEWGVVRLGDQIVGIHSLSDQRPLKIGNFDLEEADFSGKETYSQWVFLINNRSSEDRKASTDKTSAGRER